VYLVRKDGVWQEMCKELSQERRLFMEKWAHSHGCNSGKQYLEMLVQEIKDLKAKIAELNKLLADERGRNKVPRA
jgi:hypothetical protein